MVNAQMPPVEEGVAVIVPSMKPNTCQALKSKKDNLIQQGRQELSGISTLTTWKYFGSIIMTIIGLVILIFGTYLLVSVWLDGGSWSWPLYIFGFLFSAVFWGLGLWGWYQAKKLREFKMWAYELYTATSAVGAVGGTMSTISSLAKKDWSGAAMSGTSAVINTGITAYLLKPEVKKKYTEYSNQIGAVEMEMLNNNCKVKKW